MAIGGNLTNTNVNGGGGVVYGNATNVSFNGGASSYVAGTRTGGNLNGPAVAKPSTDATLQGYANAMNSTAFGSVLNAESASIESLTANSSISVVGTTATFNAKPNAAGQAVFSITGSSAFFANVTEFAFNLGSATSVFVNSDLTSGTLNANFLGGSATTIASRMLWNFDDASAITFASQWGGTVLASHARGHDAEQHRRHAGRRGSLDQRGEVHQQSFTGALPMVSAVPEPQTWALLAGGLGVMLATVRRRRAGRV